MSNPFGALFEKQPGLLAGMKGTRPMTPISDDFKAKLQASEGRQMPDFNYAGEAYDAVMIAALAAQVAGTTDPKSIAAQMVGVTIGNDPCTSIAACMDKARTGQDVAYRGITVRSGFTQAGEPSTTSYGTVHFGPTNQLDQGKTEYLRAGSESNVATQEPARGTPGSKTGAPLVFGLLMTAPTATSVTSQARFAGARLAFKDINSLAGGVLGQPVKWFEGSDGAAAATAKAQIATHKSQGVHVLIGTSGSGVSTAVMGDVINAGMVMISPSATAASLSTIDDKGLYFRTAPSDVLQARALADMIMRDGVRKVTLIGKNDAYGTGLVEGVQKELLAAGMNAASITTVKFDIEGDKVKDPNQLSTIATQVVANKPDGVLIVGTSESAEMIKALAAGQLQIRH
ncbi:hypothetical protein Rhe02_77240 [Rhizocola hellebori]|uniref:Leucine-binding protein domain-containing protein n=1 Tax=Rhizocola hellebori TaxID=1392758 RepID=A0A8J3VKL0_9ACTN|nr:ABC transporter substrate-binding protein [Rhizocola hellebori]GIH09657.1 hypothetical protein Rhe02_77240 [Rhizocola hellebori]